MTQRRENELLEAYTNLYDRQVYNKLAILPNANALGLTLKIKIATSITSKQFTTPHW